MEVGRTLALSSSLVVAAVSVLTGCDALSLNGIFGVSDGGIDAGTADAGRDAGLSDAGRGFCASLDAAPLLCDDFDHEQELTPKWSVAHSPANGVLGLSDKQRVSPPNSLSVSIGTGGNGTTETAFVSNSYTNAVSSVTLELDLFVDFVPPTDSVYFAEIDMSGQDGASVAALLQVAGGVWYLEQQIIQTNGTMTFPATVLPAINPTTWTHVTIALALGATSTATVTVAGQPAVFVTLDPSWMSSPVSFAIGWTYVNTPATARGAYFDNVIFGAH
jgi:hypothetical protein